MALKINIPSKTSSCDKDACRLIKEVKQMRNVSSRAGNAKDSTGDRSLKEQICFRIDEEIKVLMEKLAAKELRSIGNLVEKFVCERLQQLGYLNEDFRVVREESSKK
jgi:hypothetical protein